MFQKSCSNFCFTRYVCFVSKLSLFVLFLQVPAESFNECFLPNDNTKSILVLCNKPHQPFDFTVEITIFSGTIGAKDFEIGKSYYIACKYEFLSMKLGTQVCSRDWLGIKQSLGALYLYVIHSMIHIKETIMIIIINETKPAVGAQQYQVFIVVWKSWKLN